MKSATQPPTPPLAIAPKLLIRTWLNKLVGETRTRILLLYAATMLLVFVGSIPIFRAVLFNEVLVRVREDLYEELEEFQSTYETWEAEASATDASLASFAESFLATQRPEDDNFHIFFLDGKFYGANPQALPDLLQPDSAIMQEWAAEKTTTERSMYLPSPGVGSILYKTYVLESGTSKGLFVGAHLSAGEKREALAGVLVFVKVASGVMAVSFFLAWLGSRQLLKPVQQLAVTAKGINEKNLSQRLNVNGSGELAQLTATFNTMMDRVQHAFDSQRRFISDASHELRTPLTIIQGHLELMGNDPEEQQETLSLVMDELSRMGRLVNDLLLLAKAERPDFLRLEKINVAEFTAEVFNKVTALADRDWRCHNQVRGTLSADSQRLTGALINLAQNAVQHTQPDDVIEIGAEMLDERIQFWVRDTGEGISATDQSRIFKRFARVANRYRRSDGSGLGLAIVKAIAEAHDGHIELSSQKGIGSTFSLILPMKSLQECPTNDPHSHC